MQKTFIFVARYANTYHRMRKAIELLHARIHGEEIAVKPEAVTSRR